MMFFIFCNNNRITNYCEFSFFYTPYYYGIIFKFPFRFIIHISAIIYITFFITIPFFKNNSFTFSVKINIISCFSK